MPISPSPLQPPNDILTTNAWIMEVSDMGVTSPNFNKCNGPEFSSGSLTHPDGGTGHVYKFSDHIYNYGPFSIARVRGNTADDLLIFDFINGLIKSGAKKTGTFTKYHHGTIVGKISFTGLLFLKVAKPAFDTESSGKYEETYEGEVDYWEESAS